ncbi:MAG: insulinase family protein [Acidobacteriota bacterium]|nr:insulinase family protein [Blastocatellia bacterium]MDW8239131.1 insulinase family protein [Acidobacteriota bacterium]
MRKWITIAMLLVVGLWWLHPMSGLAQSGRQRPAIRPRPTEPEKQPAEKTPEKAPEPSAEPNTGAIAAGGQIVKRAFDPKTATMRFLLKNGLTVLVREKYARPMVAIAAYVKAGRLNEPEGSWGVAQLVQRLLLHGTTRRPKTQAVRELRMLGGVFDAHTADDHTVYRVALPAEKARQALDILADMLQQPAFDPETIKRQAELLWQEYDARQNDLATQASSAVAALAMPGHPIARMPAIESLRAIPVEAAVAFYQTHYRPGNVILSLVGAVNPFTVIEPIQRGYGAWPIVELSPQPAEHRLQKSQGGEQKAETTAQETRVSRQESSPMNPQPAIQLAAPPRPQSEEQTATGNQLRYDRKEMAIDQALLTVGYRLDAIEPSDRAALDVLAAVLGLGQMSQLQHELQSVLSAPATLTRLTLSRAITGESRAIELWLFQCWAPPRQFNAAELAFFNLIQRLRREFISPGQLQRAQSLLERQFYDRRAMLHDEAAELAQAEAVMGEYQEADRFVERIRSVTAEQVQRVAAKYFMLTNVAIYEVLPPGLSAPGTTAESIANWLTKQIPGIDKPVEAGRAASSPAMPFIRQGQRARPTDETEAMLFSLQPEPIRNYSVLRGSRAYVREDRARPTVAIGLFFQGGRLFEEAANNGITELMLRAMARGVKSKWNPETGAPIERGDEVAVSGDMLAIQLEQLGAELHIVNEADFFGFILNVLSRNQEQALRTLVDIIERPTFEEANVNHARAALLSEIRRRGPQPRQLAWQALLGSHPYGLPRLGQAQVVQALTAQQLRAWRERTIGQQFPIAIIVGDTDGSILVSNVIGREFRRQETDRTFRAVIPSPPAQPREQAQADNTLSALTVGFLAPQNKMDEHDVFDVIQQLMSGAGSRLTDQLCGESTLAYHAEAIYEPRLLSGGFFASLLLRPEHDAPARDVLEREFNRLVAEPIGDDELALGVNSAVSAHAVRLDQHVARVLAYTRRIFLNGQPADVDAYSERVRAVTKEKIRAVAGQYFKWTQRGVGVVRKP